MATRIQLSDMTYVEMPKRLYNRALRFTIALRIDFPDERTGELAWEGNLCYFRADHQLVWYPPGLRFLGKTQQLHYVNPTLYNIVLDMVKEHPEIIKHLETPTALLLNKAPKITVQDLEPGVPRFLDKVEE